MPRAVSNKWRSKNRGTYVIVAAFVLVIPLVLLSYHVFGHQSKVSPTLQLVSVVFRHGDRTPTRFYPNDPYKDAKYWPDGLGALTKRGKQQMYELGKTLRALYHGFLSEMYSPENLYVASSDNDRCIMSAQVCLAGLYPPVGEQVWNEGLAWQPIPVHTVPRDLDKLIVVKKPCPRYEFELNQTYHGSYFTKINSDNRELYEYVTKHSGMTVENVLQFETLYNILEVESLSNFKLPDWTTKVYKKKAEELSALSFVALTFTDTTKRLKGGPLVGEIVRLFTQKVLGSLKPNRSLYLYSGHDVTLVSLLRALGFQELFKPDYGAAVIFELHQPHDGGDHLVQLLYLNNTEHKQPIKFQIPNCEEPCKLKDFLAITKPAIPEDWESECQITKDN